MLSLSVFEADRSLSKTFLSRASVSRNDHRSNVDSSPRGIDHLTDDVKPGTLPTA